MEQRTIKLTWSEVVKWLVLIVGITSTYAIMQTKISNLETGREENRRNIEVLSERMRLQETQIASINQKLDLIGCDVTTIKNAILNSSLDPGN
jgi:hypothetical protein